MVVHITGHRAGFGWGRTDVTCPGEPDDVGIRFSVWRFDSGTTFDVPAVEETAFLLLDGEVSFEWDDRVATAKRGSLFDELPWCLHVSAGIRVRVSFVRAAELAVFAVSNEATFAPRWIAPADVRVERRGEGAVDDAAFRFVRTIIDVSSAAPEAELVLGEVLTLPGRWSSYPPHHHRQHEVYHYRFDDLRGYGHAELGEDVKKVRAFDTIKIQGGLDHAQCAAPGYAMYYAWVIRHLPGAPYTVPDFTTEHRWTMEPGAESGWRHR